MKMHLTTRPACFVLLIFGAAISIHGTSIGQAPRAIQAHDERGVAEAVVVGDVPLVHTTQVFPAEDAEPVGTSQVDSMLDRLDALLQRADSSLLDVVKLNIYLSTREIQSDVHQALAARFQGKRKPAVTFITTALPQSTAMLGADAVAVTRTAQAQRPRHPVILKADQAGQPEDHVTRDRGATATSPAGSRIYISGQAARDASLAVATRGTLAGLGETLSFLKRGKQDIVQIKAFMQPMQEAATVEAEVRKFLGDLPMPPLVLVEWRSGATAPIEIEMIAYGGANRTGAMVEYLTPPEMKASPVFARVTRINHSPTIFVSGLSANEGTSPGDDAVTDIFESLKKVLKQSGSDLRHMAKATYYVWDDASSKSLNALRPKFYDPKRPPAASKAAVPSIGQVSGGITIDMIAVPALPVDPLGSEYGPAKFGHGLNATSSAQGWLALFDGRTDFGWDKASLAGQTLTSGSTHVAFGACEVKANIQNAGEIIIGGRKFTVEPGVFHETVMSEEPEPITVRGAGLTSLAVRPIRLRHMLKDDSLAGWKPIHRGTPQVTWTIQDGVLRAVGGPGCLEFEGQMLGDFVLQLDVKTRRRHANGGVFFRAIPGDFMNGYEAQVFNRSEHADATQPARWSTGGIDDRRNARLMVSRDGEFFRMTIIAQGPQISTWINGHQQVDWLDDRAPHENARQGSRVTPGAIQLQAHDADTDIEFRRIEFAPW